MKEYHSELEKLNRDFFGPMGSFQVPLNPKSEATTLIVEKCRYCDHAKCCARFCTLIRACVCVWCVMWYADTCHRRRFRCGWCSITRTPVVDPFTSSSRAVMICVKISSRCSCCASWIRCVWLCDAADGCTVYICVHACPHVCVCVCVWEYVCVCVFVCSCLFATALWCLMEPY